MTMQFSRCNFELLGKNPLAVVGFLYLLLPSPSAKNVLEVQEVYEVDMGEGDCQDNLMIQFA